MKRPANAHVLVWLALLNLALALALAWMWLHRDASLRNTHWTVPQPVTSDYLQMLPVLPALVPVDASRLLVLLERPLFALDRRPPPPPPPPPSAALAEAPVDNFSTATVSGLVAGNGTGTVILRIAGKDQRLKLNQSVEGWQLKNIEGRTATFSKGGQSRSLRLPLAAVTTYSGTALPTLNAAAPPLDGTGGGASATDAGTGVAPETPTVRRRPRFGP